MKPPAKITQQQWLGLLLAVVAVIGLVAILTTRQKSPPVAINPVVRAPSSATSPTSYSDFVGKITAIDGNRLKLSYTLTDRDGHDHLKQYVVEVDATTAITSRTYGLSATVTAPAKLNDLAVGDIAQVSGHGDISGVNQFNALSLAKLIRNN